MKGSRQWIWFVVVFLAAAVSLLAMTGTRHLGQLAGLAALLLPFIVVGVKQMKEEAREIGQGNWEVYVNGVAVGIISGAKYLRVRREAYRDPHNALDQTINVMGVAARFVGGQLVAIPVTLFWGVVLLMLFAPDISAGVLDSLRRGETSKDLVAVVAPALVFYVLCVFAFHWLGVSVTGRDLGFRNRYDDAITERIRRYCKSPATGVVELYRPIVNPGACVEAAITERT